MSRRWMLLGFLAAALIAVPVGGVVLVDAAAAKKHHKKHHHKKHHHKKAGPCGGNGQGGHMPPSSPQNTYAFVFHCSVTFSSFTGTTTKQVSNPTAQIVNGPQAGAVYSCHTTGVHSFACSGQTVSPMSDLGGLTPDVVVRFTSSDACTTFNVFFDFSVTVNSSPNPSTVFMRCVA
jgi:hypothetical protein